jgi:hypothetical protein
MCVDMCVLGEVAESAECVLFMQCWHGIGRDCHGKVGRKHGTSSRHLFIQD